MITRVLTTLGGWNYSDVLNTPVRHAIKYLHYIEGLYDTEEKESLGNDELEQEVRNLAWPT